MVNSNLENNVILFKYNEKLTVVVIANRTPKTYLLCLAFKLNIKKLFILPFIMVGKSSSQYNETLLITFD